MLSTKIAMATVAQLVELLNKKREELASARKKDQGKN